MPLQIKTVELAEQELEDLVCAAPEQVRPGLKIISRQHPTNSGPLDVLAVDENGVLVIIELKVQPVDSHLDQALRYYDWARQNIAWIDRQFSQKYKIVSENPPRLVLVAPSFTDTVRRIAKYVQVDLQLMEFQAFQDQKGEKGILCREIDFGQPAEPPPVRTIESKLKYFVDTEVRELFLQVLSELKQRNIEVRPINNEWMSVWYKGKRMMYMGAKQRFFAVEIETVDGDWSDRQRISKREHWDQFVKQYMDPYIKHLDSKD